jgi:uncharacterized membrane protein (DUF106 family)
MTTAEIINITVTVAVVQLICDLVANRVVFSTDSYQRLCGVLRRAQFKLSKLEEQEKEGKLTGEKQLTKLKKAKNEVAEAAADIARKHISPTFFTSIVFLVLYRIFSTEYYGKAVAVLPFVPWKFFRRITMRGIDTENLHFEGVGTLKDPNQACSFVFIYILCTLSVKFFVNKAVAIKPPTGADGGLLSMRDDPQTQKMLKNWGLDNETLNKQD